MIGYVRGTISHLSVDACFVDVGGVGYRVFISSPTRARLAQGREATLFTHLSVREDAMLLYGFYAREEYELFLKLISVAKIGPKVALGILSAITADNLSKAVRAKDIAALTKLPGIGKKTAERLILELYDKLSEAEDENQGAPTLAPESAELLDEAAQAMAALGYAQAEFAPVLKRAQTLGSVEEIIKYALKEFAGRK